MTKQTRTRIPDEVTRVRNVATGEVKTMGQTPEPRLVMRDLDKRDKNLILHAAYYAVVLHDWRDAVLRSKIDRETKLDLIGKFPSGDPINNLMNLADKMLPDFDESKTINENLKMIKAFVYGGA